jgi:hypothetical protein
MTFTLQLDADAQTLFVKRAGDRSHVQVRGAPNYTTHGYDAADPLHAALDSLDPATVSVLFTGVPITLNPKNTRQAPSFATCDRLLQQ